MTPELIERAAVEGRWGRFLEVTTMSDENEPAFPIPHFARPDGDIEWGFPRLTKREYVAIQLAAGMLADESADPGSTYPPNGLAHRAVEFADALLAELAKPREDQ